MVESELFWRYKWIKWFNFAFPVINMWHDQEKWVTCQKFSTPHSGNLKMLHFDVNPIRIGYLVTEMSNLLRLKQCDPIQQKVHLVSTFEKNWDLCIVWRKIQQAFQWYQICKNWSDTFENTTFSMFVFPFIFFIFYTLFCSLSQNELGRPFVVMGHNINKQIWTPSWYLRNSICDIRLIPLDHVTYKLNKYICSNYEYEMFYHFLPQSLEHIAKSMVMVSRMLLLKSRTSSGLSR